MNAFGLISSSSTQTRDKKSFIGMGFGRRTPIDVVTLFLAGAETHRYTILLVDEFYRLNGMGKEEVCHGLSCIKETLKALGSIYNFQPDIMACSEFMQSSEYANVLNDIRQRIEDEGLHEKCMNTVPERYRESGSPLAYTTNEIVCVEFMRRNFGMQLKVGPSKETVYDEIIRELGVVMDFAYVIDAYTLGSRIPEKVVHYVPNDRGSTNGQRLYLDDSEATADSKIMMASDEAGKYLLRVASVAGRMMGKGCVEIDEIDRMPLRRIKKAAKRAVMDNIIRPYREAVGHA